MRPLSLSESRYYAAYRDLLDSERWRRLENWGARTQRLLFASTGTKDPRASDTLYVGALAAPNTFNTIPEETLSHFTDHGEAAPRSEFDRQLAETPDAFAERLAAYLKRPMEKLKAGPANGSP